MAVCPRATGAIIRAGGDRPTGPSADSVRGTLGRARHDVKKPRQEAGAWSGPETEFIEALLLVLFPPHTLTPPDGRINSVSVFSARSDATSRPQCGRRRCTDTELRRLVHMLPLHCGSCAFQSSCPPITAHHAPMRTSNNHESRGISSPLRRGNWGENARKDICFDICVAPSPLPTPGDKSLILRGENWRALRESNPCFRRERAAS